MFLASIPDTVTTDSTLYSKVAWGQVPDNGFYYSSNWYGVGDLVNGVNYTHQMTARAKSFPNGTVMEWSFPSSGGTGLNGFAYGWPELWYGGGYYGNPYNSVGPWPMKVNDLTTLTATYDLTIGGNTNHFDMLMDFFVTASPTSTDGSYVAEFSFFPYANANFLSGALGPILTNTSVVTFACGECKVGIQGTQICVLPTSGGGTVSRNILSGTIDLKEIFDYLVSIGIGGITGDEYVRGIEFGPEVQVPASFNTGPYAGWVRFNHVSFVWA